MGLWEGGHRMREYRADVAALTLLQLGLCALAGGLSAAAALFLDPWPKLMLILIVVFVSLAAVGAIVLLPMYFRRLRCVCTSSQISFAAGILFLRAQRIRIERVQFVQTIVGPADGILGLNCIILYVYGGQLVIPFLSRKDRKELEQFLQERGVFHAS